MQEIFDLRQFFASILRRLKLFAAVVLCCSLGWAFLRLAAGVYQYVSYREPAADQEEGGAQTSRELPYTYNASYLVYIEPRYEAVGNAAVDQNGTIADFISAAGWNEELMSRLADRYFSRAREDDLAWKRNMVACDYRTSSVLAEEYTFSQFITSFKTEKFADSCVRLSASFNQEELANEMGEAFALGMLDVVRTAMGEFEYQIFPVATTSLLPTPTPGLIPKPAGGTTASGQRPAFSDIIKKSVKGAVWGAALGAALAVIAAFVSDATRLTLENERDIDSLKLRLLCVGAPIGRKRKVVDRWIDRLEGFTECGLSVQDCCAMAMAQIRAGGRAAERILVTGSCAWDVVRQFGTSLAEIGRQDERTIQTAPFILKSPETVSAAAAGGQVVLVERCGQSCTDDVRREIVKFEELGCGILGVILIK